MRIQSILCRVLPFVFTFACGAFLASWFTPIDIVVQVPTPAKSSDQHSGIGPGIDRDRPDVAESEVRAGTNPLRIISKPIAKYTDEARVNNVEGKVRLKVTLLASGQVGAISVVERLPQGLTEQAIAAARQIRFEPATKDGVPVSKTITIDYSFTIY